MDSVSKDLTQMNKQQLEYAMQAIYNRQPIDNIQIKTRTKVTSLIGALADYLCMSTTRQQKKDINRNINSINFDMSGNLMVSSPGTTGNSEEIFNLIYELVQRADMRINSRLEREQNRIMRKQEELLQRQQQLYQEYLNKLESDRRTFLKRQQTQAENYQKKLLKEQDKKSQANTKKLSTLNDTYTLSIDKLMQISDNLLPARFVIQTDRNSCAILKGKAISLAYLLDRYLRNDFDFRQYFGSELRRQNDDRLIDPRDMDGYIDNCISDLTYRVRNVYLGYNTRLGRECINIYAPRELKSTNESYLILIKAIKVNMTNTPVEFNIKLFEEVSRIADISFEQRVRYLKKNSKKANNVDIKLLELDGQQTLANELRAKRKGLLGLFG
jgi:exonuclease VII large subunit